MEHEANQGELYHDPHGDFECDLSDDRRARIKSELEPGEHLLWAGRSNPERTPIGYRFYVVSILALLLVPAAISFFQQASALGGLSTIDGVERTVLASFVLVFALLFIAVAVGMIVIKRADFWRRSNVFYAVTDCRILFWIPESREGKTLIISTYAKEIANVFRAEGRDGAGDLIFSLRKGWHHDYYRGFLFQCELLGVPKVRRIERIVRQNLLNSDSTQDA